MSADEAPSRTVQLPQFNDIDVFADEISNDVWICYVGSAEDLVTAGIVTPPMLAMGHKGDRSRRFDADGDKWRITTWWVGNNCGQPRRRFRAVVIKPLAVARRMPGVSQALAAALAHEAYYNERREAHARREAEPRRKPRLRLVVDNTQPEVQS